MLQTKISRNTAPDKALGEAPTAPRFLLQGIDTLQCAYYLQPKRAPKIDFVQLRALRDSLREARDPDPQPLRLGSMEFLLAPHGSASGYPFILSNTDYRIEFGQNNNPSFYVTFRSEALWREPVAALHERFLAWAAEIGFLPLRPETLSRVDFCFDYQLPLVDFDEDSFVSLASKDSQHRNNGAVQTFTFGRDDVVLRVYDKVAEILEKSSKTWLFDLWGVDSDVWRIEWQVRKNMLRRFGIRTYDDLHAQVGALLQYLAQEHDTLRARTTDRNRSRWPLHPLWVDLHNRIESFQTTGTSRALDATRRINERIARIVLSLNGYVKQFAALKCVLRGRDTMAHQEALEILVAELRCAYDRFTWDLDVAKRIKQIELGQ